MKRLFSMLLVLAMVLTLLPTVVLAEEKTTVSVVAAEYGSQTARWWEDFEKLYESKYPDVDLVVNVCNWGDIYGIVQTRIEAGMAPDILNLDTYAEYAASGMLLPAEDWLSDATYGKFSQNFLNASKLNGTVWAVPDLTSTRAFYYNKDILDAAGASVPATMADIPGVAAKIKAYYGDAVIPWAMDMSNEAANTFALYGWNSYGGGLLDDQGNWALNSAMNYETFCMVRYMYQEGLTGGTELTRYDIQDLFADGQVAMTVAPDSFQFNLSGADNSINYGVAPIPATNCESTSIAVMDRMMCFDNHYSETELAAIEDFFDLFYDDAVHLEWTQLEGFLPATTTGAALLAQQDPDRAAWAEVLSNARFLPTGKAEWGTYRSLAAGVFEDILNSESTEQACDILDEFQAAVTGTSVPGGDGDSDKTVIDALVPWYGENSHEWWAEFEVLYESKYPDVDLVLEICSWNDIYGILETRIESGEIPDILEMDMYADYGKSGMLLSAEEYLTAGTYAKFGKGFLEEQEKLYGTTWAVPDLTSTRAMYYNKDILNAAGASVPTNWEEVLEASEKIKAHYGDSVIPWALDMGNESMTAFALYGWNNGGGLVDNAGEWALNSDRNNEIFSIVQEMYANGLTNGMDLTRWDIDGLFDNGQVAMTISPDYLQGGLGDVNFGIAPIPASNGDSASISVMDYMMCFDNGQSDTEMTAIRNFFDLFYDDEIHANWTQLEGFLPATVTGMEHLAEQDPDYAVWAEALDGSRFLPTTKEGWDVYRDESYGVFERILNGENVEQVLDEFQAAVTGTSVPGGDGDVTEITLWTYPLGDWGSEAIYELLDRFMADNPGIQVNVEFLDYMTGDEKVNTAIAAGSTPDLILEGPERVAAMWGEYMADLSDLMDAQDQEEIYSGALSAVYSGDKLAMYPMAGTVHTMAINKTVFEAAGAMQYINEDTHTWKSTEDFIAAVNQVYAYTGQTVGTVYCGGRGGDQGTRALVNNLYGGTYTNAAHTRYTWDSQENIQALQTLYDCDGLEFRTDMAGGDEIEMFRSGALSMAFCWNIAQQGTDTTYYGDEIMFLAFPSDGEPQLASGIFGLGVFDNGDDARIEAAKTFVKYMCDSEATEDAVKATGYFPVRSDLKDMWEGNELNSEYNKLMPYMGDYYVVTPNWQGARDAWVGLLQDVANGNDIAEAAKYWNTVANGGEEEKPGDMDGDGVVDDSDVARLLWHTLFEDAYEINGDADFNKDGTVDDQDVAYLLWHTLFPDAYPIN